jgi:adenylylsulfate kinase
MKILICGLPGSGKTYLSKILQNKLPNSSWFNADVIREQYNDWDFSIEGRLRQSNRMKSLADTCMSDYAILDFVAPLESFRDIVNADYTIWMDTIKSGRFEDTNKIFENPIKYDLRIDDFNYSINNILQGLFL